MGAAESPPVTAPPTMLLLEVDPAVARTVASGCSTKAAAWCRTCGSIARTDHWSRRLYRQRPSSVALFAALAAVMMATRRIDWYALFDSAPGRSQAVSSGA